MTLQGSALPAASRLRFVVYARRVADDAMKLATPLILVIDDDEQVRNFLKASLTRSGYGVWDAACGDLAARILGERRIDLIIGDAGRLDPDGENTLRKLRRVQPGIKILAMTGKFPAARQPCFCQASPPFSDHGNSRSQGAPFSQRGRDFAEAGIRRPAHRDDEEAAGT